MVPATVGLAAVVGNYIDVNRRFLREVSGVQDNIGDGGSWAGLIEYFQGIFA